MSRIILKYPLPTPANVIPFGPDDRVLTVATQNGTPMVWVEHKYPVSPTQRMVWGIPTGAGPSPGTTYIGTAHGVHGDMVFHIYMKDVDGG